MPYPVSLLASMEKDSMR